jgi:DNA recombination protein RmuC
MFMFVLTAILAFSLGACIVTLVLGGRASAVRTRLAAVEAELSGSRTSIGTLQSQLGTCGAELRASTERRAAAETEAVRLAEQLKQQELQFAQQLRQQEQQATEKLALLAEAKVELSNQFKALASEILEEKSKRFTEQNQTNLTQLLTPLSEKIKIFQQKVEEVYVQEGKDRSALSEQVRLLMEQTQQISGEAGRLTRALTTQAKAQGDLGEMILEKILETSGLRKGVEYVVQNSFLNEDSRQARPDVIVKLPENKHLVIDSKVSLTAYSEYVNAETDEARKVALARHMESVRRHIRELAEKNYQALLGLQSIDFVCMFVPIEGAFMAAIGNDPALWESSYARNVLLVSPSTLLFVVRTVAHLWRQERQKQNVQEIVNRGAELYDRLVGFVDELKSVGERLEQARSSYGQALSKLATGKGNVIRQAEMLKALGVKPKKSLPLELVDGSGEDELLLPEQADAAGKA